MCTMLLDSHPICDEIVEWVERPEDPMARRKNDPAGARDAICNAAMNVFAEKGFDGAKIQEIAERAGVTKSLIHHHVGNKDALWKEVKATMFAQYFEAQRAIILSRDADLDVMRNSIQAYFQFFMENPKVIRLLVWMLMEERENPDAEIDDPSDGLTEFGVNRLVNAQKAGTIRDDIHPFYMLTAFFSLVEHWFMARHEYGCRFPHGLAPEMLDEEYLHAITEIMMHGIAPR